MSELNNKEQAESIVNRFLESNLVANVVFYGTIAKVLAEIYVPLGVAGYILRTQNDKLVLGLGVAFALLSVVNTFKVVKTAVTSKPVRTKRK